jgi:hypothetical protein
MQAEPEIRPLALPGWKTLGPPPGLEPGETSDIEKYGILP